MGVRLGQFYPIHDFFGRTEELRFGNVKSRQNIRATWTGEFRAPNMGEWYLSGAEVAAYKARADLSDSYHIARLCRTKTITVETSDNDT